MAWFINYPKNIFQKNHNHLVILLETFGFLIKYKNAI